MISAPDRLKAVELIDEAREAGARLAPACRTIGIASRTYQRWTREGQVASDGRPDAIRPRPGHALSDAEREEVLAICNRPEFADLPPGQIVPRLADRGEYLASESTFYRVLRAAGQQHHRGRANAPTKPRPPATHCADAPDRVWCWDISWLPGPIRGQFFFLYLILDLFSRKIVGWEVHDTESAANSRELIERTVWRCGCIDRPLVLHGDNGSPLKGSTVQAMMARLGITPSYSRPRVSDDNAFVESLFRTCKYVPNFPRRGFASLDEARRWVQEFVERYNHHHLHRGIQFVTPEQRYRGDDTAILKNRHAVYQAARRRYPARWSGATRNWNPVGDVWLNPERDRPLDKKVA